MLEKVLPMRKTRCGGSEAVAEQEPGCHGQATTPVGSLSAKEGTTLPINLPAGGWYAMQNSRCCHGSVIGCISMFIAATLSSAILIEYYSYS